MGDWHPGGPSTLTLLSLSPVTLCQALQRNQVARSTSPQELIAKLRGQGASLKELFYSLADPRSGRVRTSQPLASPALAHLPA